MFFQNLERKKNLFSEISFAKKKDKKTKFLDLYVEGIGPPGPPEPRLLVQLKIHKILPTEVIFKIHAFYPRCHAGIIMHTTILV